jgi:hypothetical protein
MKAGFKPQDHRTHDIKASHSKKFSSDLGPEGKGGEGNESFLTQSSQPYQPLSLLVG